MEAPTRKHAGNAALAQHARLHSSALRFANLDASERLAHRCGHRCAPFFHSSKVCSCEPTS